MASVLVEPTLESTTLAASCVAAETSPATDSVSNSVSVSTCPRSASANSLKVATSAVESPMDCRARSVMGEISVSALPITVVIDSRTTLPSVVGIPTATTSTSEEMSVNEKAGGSTFRAINCAAHSPLLSAVAVLSPVAPPIAWTTSANSDWTLSLSALIFTS